MVHYVQGASYTKLLFYWRTAFEINKRKWRHVSFLRTHRSLLSNFIGQHRSSVLRNWLYHLTYHIIQVPLRRMYNNRDVIHYLSLSRSLHERTSVHIFISKSLSYVHTLTFSRIQSKQLSPLIRCRIHQRWMGQQSKNTKSFLWPVLDMCRRPGRILALPTSYLRDINELLSHSLNKWLGIFPSKWL